MSAHHNCAFPWREGVESAVAEFIATDENGLRGQPSREDRSTPRSPIRMRHRLFDRYTDAADGSRCTESSLAQGISVYPRTTTAAAELNRDQSRGHELVDAEVLGHQLMRDLPFDLPGDGEENGDDGPGGEPGHDGPPEPDAPDASGGFRPVPADEWSNL
jgi:hypothetical protein